LGLAKDISNSVYRTNRGYLEMLEKDNSIQDRFENAIENDPKKSITRWAC